MSEKSRRSRLEAPCSILHHLYRSMDFLEKHKTEVEKAVYFQMAALMDADVDLIFYDTTSLHFEIDDEDDEILDWCEREYEPLRKRGHSKNGRRDAPQIVVGLAVTRDGLPVRSWVFPGNTTDVATVRKVKKDLSGWRLSRCVFVGDAGMNSAENRRELALGGGKYILASKMRAGDEVTNEVLTRAGRYRAVDENLRIKQVEVGGQENYDGKWVVTSNDDTLSVEDLALGYKQLMRVEDCWRTLESGLHLRPVYHWTSWRIQAHVTICVLALLLERIVEIRCGDTWRNIRDDLASIKVVEYDRSEYRIRQRSELQPKATALLEKVGAAMPREFVSIVRIASESGEPISNNGVAASGKSTS